MTEESIEDVKQAYALLLKENATLRAECERLKRDAEDAERFRLWADNKINLLPQLITACCEKQELNIEWWRAAIDAALKETQ